LNTFYVILNIVIFLAAVFFLNRLAKKHVTFNIRVMIGLGLGVVFGIAMQLIYNLGSPIIKESNDWFNIFGTGYVNLLKMIIIPLVFVSISTSILQQTTKNMGKSAITILTVLIVTVAIAATVGAASAKVFDLNPITVEAGASEANRGDYLENTLESYKKTSIQTQIINIIPTNIFYAMTGQDASATLSVVFFAALVGFAAIQIKKKKPDSAGFFINMLTSLKDVVMRIVALVLRLTPYGVLAIMTKTLSTSKFQEISKLLTFLLVSYFAMLVMFIIHGILLYGFGLNPLKFFKKSASVFAFAFSSRSSAATLPMTTANLTKNLGVNEGIGNLAASLGTTIGQNGCAGIYPAMVAVMVASATGVPLTAAFFVKLILITAITSFGIAGVGGGATFAGLAVLSSMGLPVALVGVLISIEPLIDMARTTLNVSDGMLAGVIASKINKDLDMDVYNSKLAVAEASEAE
jgi:L-cystine uptake protein TcyP (sodium:dicarboxylate symporter family)